MTAAAQVKPQAEDVNTDTIKREVARLLPVWDNRVTRAVQGSARPVSTLFAALVMLKGLEDKVRASLLKAGVEPSALARFEKQTVADERPGLLKRIFG